MQQSEEFFGRYTVMNARFLRMSLCHHLASYKMALVLWNLLCIEMRLPANAASAQLVNW